MIFKKLIEGYSDRDVSNRWVYNLIYRKKEGEISSLESQISNLTSQINTLTTELPNKTLDYNTNKSILEREINNKKDQITNLKNEIDDLKKKKEDLQFDIEQGGVERNIKLSDLNNKNSDWIDAKNDTK
jgi:chromosome segregation ATPase